VKIDLGQFKALFFEEAAEHLETMETGLVRLEDSSRDPELVNGIFRAAHSIKGASGSFGLTEIASFTHHLESALDRLRNGTLATSRELTDLLLRAADVLRGLVASAQHGAPTPAAVGSVEAELERLLHAATAASPAAPAPAAAAASAPARAASSASEGSGGELREVRVRFVPHADLFLHGADPLLVLRDLAEESAAMAVTTSLEALPPLSELDPERCYLRFDAQVRTARSDHELRDLFAFVEDGSEIVISSAAASASAGSAAGARIASAPPGAPAAAERGGQPERSSIRVPTEKVDRIINLVGELVIAQSMILDAMQRVDGDGAPALRAAVSAMERNTRDLQERVMSVRMMPLATVFQRFPRLVRDLAGSLGKKIDLDVVGDEIELDRGVIERIGDPLIHLLRNALDHGFETPGDRRAAGKPERGRLSIHAAHRGGNVHIQVSDDGRGLDITRIRRKAVAQGLVDPAAELTPEQVTALLFLPGFSTAEQVTDVSGRGVGMDVVKRNVEALSGTVVLTSEPGRGTTCTIRLPLTLAILEGLSLRVADQCFIVPLVNVVESFLPRQEDRRTVFGRGELIHVRGKNLPLVRLHRFFGLAEPEGDDRGIITVVEHGAHNVALLVDELLGQSQVVLKSLETNYQRVEGIGGVTILGDGRIALVLDLQGIIRSVTGGELRAA
jgi:two-component system, chemotaxis family, sensor kinase CheA